MTWEIRTGLIRCPNAWTTFNPQSMLGGALLGQEKCVEAIFHSVALPSKCSWSVDTSQNVRYSPGLSCEKISTV